MKDHTSPTDAILGGPCKSCGASQASRARGCPKKRADCPHHHKDTNGKRIFVQVAREFDGSVYSRVIDKAQVDVWNGEPKEIVIDRKSRLLDARIIRRRAERLAEMLGVPFEEDLRWPCIANRKMACRCPKCIEEGRA